VVFLLTTFLAVPAGTAALQPLTGVRSVVSAGDSNCALLVSGKVDCWGSGNYGQLGNGESYRTGAGGSAVPVAVEGVGRAGTLDDVTSLYSVPGAYCAILTSKKVDCWGE
jgi:alpha-tubulin suppressor-like RCC1 family protein